MWEKSRVILRVRAQIKRVNGDVSNGSLTDLLLLSGQIFYFVVFLSSFFFLVSFSGVEVYDDFVSSSHLSVVRGGGTGSVAVP